MKFEIESWTIKELIDKYNSKGINLNPPYQRNDIWSLPAKKRLIDTILKGYPLPSFFLHKNEESGFDVVDGQQRIRTLLGFCEGLFSTEDNKKIDDIDRDYFYDVYIIPVIIIEDLHPDLGESMEEFYYRVNKFGTKLNRPEILRSQYFDSPLQKLIERITESDEFTSINIFTESLKNRMIDYDFVGELIVLLIDGITDKKLAVDRLYETFSDDEAEGIEERFFEILSYFSRFDKIYSISETRYKQRNDFYTLFHFINENSGLQEDTLDYIYSLLVLFSDDIYPTNEKCFAFQDYAFNCVSQSNSKKAREDRYKILSDILLNIDPKPFDKEDTDQENANLLDVLKFYHFSNDDLVARENLHLIDIEQLNSQKSEIEFLLK